VSESFSFNIKWIKSSEDLEAFALLPKNSIAIIDNFENFANKDVNKNFTPSLLSTIDSSKKGHFFIISTNKMVSVEERLRNNGRFEVEIEFSVPNNIDRVRSGIQTYQIKGFFFRFSIALF
jgi:AAA+ superfamily predicted ATPase